MIQKGFWRTLPGSRLLKLITAVSAVAISYEGMSQGVMGAVNVAPEYGVCNHSPLTH
jgi:hypothetical protein